MTMTIGDIEKIKEEMCDSFCCVPYEASDEEEATELCKLCPLNKLDKWVEGYDKMIRRMVHYGEQFDERGNFYLKFTVAQSIIGECLGGDHQ